MTDDSGCDQLAEMPLPAEPLALLDGLPVTECPRDLYIPPDALRVFLESFEGPLDLLLYLIRKQDIDILHIPIAPITEQYMRYIDLMLHLQMDLIGEYLVMAAMLAEIKSRLLLPQFSPAEEEEKDPTADLVRRLEEYEFYKKAAGALDALPRCERDFHAAHADFPQKKSVRVMPGVSMDQLVGAYAEALQRSSYIAHHTIELQILSVRERMGQIMKQLTSAESRFVDFCVLCRPEGGRPEVIASFLALLELLRQSLIEITQEKTSNPIYVRALRAN